MPWVKFEPTIPTSEWAKTVHAALDRSATVTGLTYIYIYIYIYILLRWNSFFKLLMYVVMVYIPIVLVSLTTGSGTLLEKLTVAQLVMKFLVSYGTGKFITIFTTPRHSCLAWARWIFATFIYITSLRPILILSSYVHLPNGLIPSSFLIKMLYSVPHTPHAFWIRFHLTHFHDRIPRKRFYMQLVLREIR
jgi:hypothetical protein